MPLFQFHKTCLIAEISDFTICYLRFSSVLLLSSCFLGSPVWQCVCSRCGSFLASWRSSSEKCPMTTTRWRPKNPYCRIEQTLFWKPYWRGLSFRTHFLNFLALLWFSWEVSWHYCFTVSWSSFVVETQPSMPQGKGPLVLRTNVQFSVKTR